MTGWRGLSVVKLPPPVGLTAISRNRLAPLKQPAQTPKSNCTVKMPLLTAAAAFGAEKSVALLLDKGAQLEAKDSQGFTALLRSTAGGNGRRVLRPPDLEELQELTARAVVVEAAVLAHDRQ